jgi:hypothetical protein
MRDEFVVAENYYISGAETGVGEPLEGGDSQNL